MCYGTRWSEYFLKKDFFLFVNLMSTHSSPMKKVFILKLLILFSVFAVLEVSVFAAAEKNLWDALDVRQQELLKGGKQVLIAEQIPGVLWPSFHVYRLLEVPPLQAVAVFWDVEYATHYIPDCLKASIEALPKPNVIIANYEVRVPFLPKDVSKVRDEITELPGGVYKISWEVLQSTYSKSGHGSFIALPHGSGTLLCYSNFINPENAIALLLQKQAQSRVEAAAAAIAHQIELEARQAPEQLAAQVEQVNIALKK